MAALAMSYLFPHDVRIVGPGTDERCNRAYFDRVVELLALAKSHIVVLGSGWTRNIPERWTLDRAEVRGLADFDHMDGEGEAQSADHDQGDRLAHVHRTDTGRMNLGTGKYDYPTFFGHLKASGDSGLLSAECGVIGEPVAAMRTSADFFRRTWVGAKD